MQSDRMATPWTLRQRALDGSRAAFAAALSRQDAAERQLAAADRSIRQETERATDPQAPDQLVEAFGAWLPEGQRRRTEAQAAMDFAVARAAQARTAMAMIRAALQASDTPGHAVLAAAVGGACRQD